MADNLDYIRTGSRKCELGCTCGRHQGSGAPRAPKHQPRVTRWSFWNICTNCDTTRAFLVNEMEGAEKVWARCPTCSSLLVVTDEHREGAVDKQLR